LLFAEIVERSELTTQSWLLSAEVLATERIQSVLNNVIEAGGMWEQAFGGLLLVHTPADMAKAVFENITDTASKGA